MLWVDKLNSCVSFMYGDLPLLSQINSIALNYFTQPEPSMICTSMSDLCYPWAWIWFFIHSPFSREHRRAWSLCVPVEMSVGITACMHDGLSWLALSYLPGCMLPNSRELQRFLWNIQLTIPYFSRRNVPPSFSPVPGFSNDLLILMPSANTSSGHWQYTQLPTSGPMWLHLIHIPVVIPRPLPRLPLTKSWGPVWVNEVTI